MRFFSGPSVKGSLALVLISSTLFACSSGTSTEGFPQIANPPPFDYADGRELRSHMHRFAFELQQLDLALMDTSEYSPELQSRILNRLQNIQDIGESLQTGDLATNHSFLALDMELFLRTVDRAEEGMRRRPPQYYLAGRVSGACVNCHQIVQGTTRRLN